MSEAGPTHPAGALDHGGAACPAGSVSPARDAREDPPCLHPAPQDFARLRDEQMRVCGLVERGLSASLDDLSRDPLAARALEPMCYALLGGGKRVRPFLAVEFARLFSPPGGEDAAERAAMPFALALEMVHTYSLIHDDLPCMDDDDLRRGKPSCHKAFGEARAVLAGDGLQALAFSVAAQNPILPPERTLAGVRLLAGAAGVRGMVGGQALDIENEESEEEPNPCVSVSELEDLNDRKTGALLVAACRLGALSAGAAPGGREDAVAARYGVTFGRAFQLTDDLLDRTGDPRKIGKSVGRDAAARKRTYPALLGDNSARAHAKLLVTEAQLSLVEYGARATHLTALAATLLTREK